MSIQVQSELASFHEFIAQQLQAKPVRMTPEEALDLWREEHPDPDQLEEDRQAILESLADLAAGEQGMTLEEFDREFRRRNNLPPRQ